MIPALHDMVLIAGSHDLCDISHECTVLHYLPIFNNLVLCPRNYLAIVEDLRSVKNAFGLDFFDLQHKHYPRLVH